MLNVNAINARVTQLALEDGRARGSWVIDGNTTVDTAHCIIAGYDEGDPLTMDMCPNPLSGEWAGDPTPGSLAAELFGSSPVDGSVLDQICTDYELAFAEGFWNEVLKSARAILRPESREPITVREGYPAPIAYTWDADYHCPSCTAEVFGVDSEGWIPESAEDSEGNPIGVVAPWDEWIEPSLDGPQSLACGTCGGIVDEYDPGSDG